MLVFPEILASHDKDQFVCQTFVCDQKTQQTRTFSTNTFGGQIIFADVFPCLIVTPHSSGRPGAQPGCQLTSHLWADSGD